MSIVEFGFFRNKSTAVIGLDISSGLVKLLELSRGPQGFHVERYAVEYLPANAMQEKAIKNVEAVGMTIERVVKHSRTAIRQAAVAVTGSAVITKTIQMNADLKDNEMALQIQLEAERYIPYPLQEVNLDFQVLGPSTQHSALVDVLLVASRTEIIDTLIEALAIGGLKAKVVDIEAYAIQRAFTLMVDKLPSKGEKQTTAIVDIGSTTTSFNVLYDGSIVYTQFTEAIQHHYGLPFEEALVQQVSRSMQFFFSSSQFSAIDHIVLAGGSASILGLVQKVEEKLEIPVSLANPFANMTVSPRVSVSAIHADSPSLMVCCGLAMRSFV